MAYFDIKDYETVADRIVRFYKKYPDGRIITKKENSEQDYFLMKAAVYKSGEDLKENLPIATGWADETAGTSLVNKTSPLENCETSAIGRALANAGFSVSKQRASAEEMVKVVSRGAK